MKWPRKKSMAKLKEVLRANGLCKFGFALGMRWRAWQSNCVLIPP
jgi:hypothetical protein